MAPIEPVRLFLNTRTTSRYPLSRKRNVHNIETLSAVQEAHYTTEYLYLITLCRYATVSLDMILAPMSVIQLNNVGRLWGGTVTEPGVGPFRL